MAHLQQCDCSCASGERRETILPWVIGEVEIALHDKQGDEPFAMLVAELGHVFMGMSDDGFGFVRMSYVMVEPLLKVGEVGLDFYVVVVGLQPSLHEPCLAGWSWHDCDRVGRHHPLQIACHIVSLKCHDEFVVEMLTDGELLCLPLWVLRVDYTHIAQGDGRRIDARNRSGCVSVRCLLPAR